jgi:hypothetical protein
LIIELGRQKTRRTILINNRANRQKTRQNKIIDNRARQTEDQTEHDSKQQSQADKRLDGA